ncbi:MAG: Cof-type HAD-IIB family hydrolase [Planctomycetota bacterium]
MQQPRLMALDLDGTLLDASCRIPVPHRDAVAEIRALGVQVALVTGRPVLTTAPVHKALDLNTPMVCFNGTWIGRPDEEPLAEMPLEQDEVRAVVAAMRPWSGVISCYSAEHWIMDRVIPHTADWPKRYDTDGIRIDDARIHAWQGDSPKVMFVHPDHSVIPQVVAALKQRFGQRFHVVASQEDRLEVHRPGITKAWGLARLADLLQIPQDAVWAAGDADNDTEMLGWAGVPCAMGQAPAHLQALARHVLPGIEQAGLTALPRLLAAAGARGG